MRECVNDEDENANHNERNVSRALPGVSLSPDKCHSSGVNLRFNVLNGPEKVIVHHVTVIG